MVNIFDSKKQENEHEVEIFSLSIVNVPSDEDAGPEAAPYKESLELMYLESNYQEHYNDWFKKKHSEAVPENYAKMACYASSLVVSMHTDYVEITSTNGFPLPIRIDGVDYEDYHAIKVQIVQNASIPIMTFLPIY